MTTNYTINKESEELLNEFKAFYKEVGLRAFSSRLINLENELFFISFASDYLNIEYHPAVRSYAKENQILNDKQIEILDIAYQLIGEIFQLNIDGSIAEDIEAIKELKQYKSLLNLREIVKKNFKKEH